MNGLARALGARLETAQIGREILWLDEVSSTMLEARRLAEEGAPHGAVVLAEAQRAGRGRLGRAWHSPPGRSLYLTLLLRPTLPPARLPLLTPMMALAAADALEGVGVRSGIKWPNDVMVGPLKIGGILAEVGWSGPSCAWVLLGIGLNLNLAREELPEELRAVATSAQIEVGAPVDRLAVASRLLGSFERRYDQGSRDNLAQSFSEWRSRCVTLGRGVAFEQQGEVVRGLAVDLTEDGSLLVETSAGTRHRVTAGDVRLEG